MFCREGCFSIMAAEVAGQPETETSCCSRLSARVARFERSSLADADNRLFAALFLDHELRQVHRESHKDVYRIRGLHIISKRRSRNGRAAQILT
jgi:hypothetical protein